MKISFTVYLPNKPKMIAFLNDNGIKFENNETAFIEWFKVDEKHKKVVMDFILHQNKEDMKAKISQRRWDVYHTLSSTLYSMVIGLLVGIGLRIYYEWFLIEPIFEISFFTGIRAQEVELIAIIIFTVILVVVFWLGRKRLMRNYYPLLEAFLRYEIKQVGEELAIAFPEYFGKVKTD